MKAVISCSSERTNSLPGIANAGLIAKNSAQSR
jgi:hypothetical protein